MNGLAIFIDNTTDPFQLLTQFLDLPIQFLDLIFYFLITPFFLLDSLLLNFILVAFLFMCLSDAPVSCSKQTC